MNPHFTKEEQKQLNKRLRNLEKVCRPTGLLTPNITFKTKEEFDYLDTLKTYQESRIEPKDLAQMWEPQEHLNARGLGFIQVNGEKWFYDKVSPVSNIFSQDGSKMISIAFPCFTDTPAIWSMPETYPIIKGLIQECQKSFPPNIDTTSLFPDDFCQKLYNKTAANEPPEVAILKMMETLRRILVKKLIDNNTADIKKTKAYQEFAVAHPNKQNDLIEFLRSHKNLIFMLSEKAGYIKKAKLLPRYHQKRDHVRHPDEVPEIIIAPQKILEDFYKILQMEKPKTKARPSLDLIYKNMETSLAFDELVKLKEVLMDKTNHQYKYDKKDFWAALEQQGTLTKSESECLQEIIKTGNCVGHANQHEVSAQTRLVDRDEAYVGNMLMKLLGRPY